MTKQQAAMIRPPTRLVSGAFDCEAFTLGTPDVVPGIADLFSVRSVIGRSLSHPLQHVCKGLQREN